MRWKQEAFKDRYRTLKLVKQKLKHIFCCAYLEQIFKVSGCEFLHRRCVCREPTNGIAPKRRYHSKPWNLYLLVTEAQSTREEIPLVELLNSVVAIGVKDSHQMRKDGLPHAKFKFVENIRHEQPK